MAIFPILLVPLGLMLWLAWRFLPRKARWLVPLFVFVIAYLMFREIHPSDRFYIDEFTSDCQATLSPSARVVCARVDFPPHLGDYTSEALIEVDAADFARLFTELETRKGHSAERLSESVTQVCGRKIDVQASLWDLTPGHDWIVWGLLRDGKTLFFRATIT